MVRTLGAQCGLLEACSHCSASMACSGLSAPFAFIAPFSFFAPFARRELDTPFVIFAHSALFGPMASPLPLPAGTELSRGILRLLCSLRLLCPLYSKGTRCAVCSLRSLCILWSVGAAAPITRWRRIVAAYSLPSLLPSTSLPPLVEGNPMRRLSSLHSLVRWCRRSHYPLAQNCRGVLFAFFAPFSFLVPFALIARLPKLASRKFLFAYWRLDQAVDGLPPRSVSRTSYPAQRCPMTTIKSGPFCHNRDCLPIFQSTGYSSFLGTPRISRNDKCHEPVRLREQSEDP